MYKQSQVSVKQARRILGTSAKGLSDKSIAELVEKVGLLSEVVIISLKGSKIKGDLDISKHKVDTGV